MWVLKFTKHQQKLYFFVRKNNYNNNNITSMFHVSFDAAQKNILKFKFHTVL